MSFPGEMINLLVAKIHQHLFNQPMGSNMRLFVKNLSWISLGSFVSTGFLFVTNLTASRLLGPIEYGKYSMVIYLSSFITIPMVAGLTTSLVNHLSSTQPATRQDTFITSAFFLTSLTTLITFLFIVLNQSTFSQIFHLTPKIIIAGTVYSALLSLKQLYESALRGKFHFFKLAILETITSITVFVVFFIQILVRYPNNYQIITRSIIISLIVYILFSHLFILKSISLKNIHRSSIYQLLSYSKYSIIGSLSGLLIGNIDKLVLNSLLGIGTVGLYSAYLNASTILSGIFLPLFLNVYFPSVSQITDKTQILHKLSKVFSRLFVPLLAINFLCMSLYVLLLGQQYPFNLFYILLFSFQNIIFIFSNILWWSINSLGTKGIKYTSLTGFILGGTNILITVPLVITSGIPGLIIASTLTYIFMYLVAYRKLQSSSINHSNQG